jgi:LPPG:FO 2-phospho-L-lactate transferase
MKIVALAGGVGGAKLAEGLAQLLPSDELSIVVNTGDDFEHFGLYICPDLDTVCYTLAGLSNPETGWGRHGETFHALESIQAIGGPSWFRLGDKDLATHLERTRRLHDGQSLDQVTQEFCQAWGVRHTVLPMSNQPVRTMVNTCDHGELAFQEYFVHMDCEPKVTGFRFTGVESAMPAPGVLEAMDKADAIVFCPSNPWVSIDPILAVKGIRSAIALKTVVAVSPIIGGQTIKGPAAKMYSEMGIQPSPVAVVNHYAGLLSGLVFDTIDADLERKIPIPVSITQTIMKNQDGRYRLAQDVLNLIQKLRSADL